MVAFNVFLKLIFIEIDREVEVGCLRVFPALTLFSKL